MTDIYGDHMYNSSQRAVAPQGDGDDQISRFIYKLYWNALMHWCLTCQLRVTVHFDIIKIRDIYESGIDNLK